MDIPYGNQTAPVNPAGRSGKYGPGWRSDHGQHLAGRSRVDALGRGQVWLRAGLREMAGGGNGLSKARRIPIEVPEGAERGSQPAGSRAAGLRGRHCNHLYLCWGGLWIPDPGADGPPRV